MVAVVSQENIAALARTGRHLQRYSKGRRQVVGLVLFCFFLFFFLTFPFFYVLLSFQNEAENFLGNFFVVTF